MLLAALLGGLRLGWRPLWYDESFSVLFARTEWAVFWDVTWAKELNALLYYLLLRGWINLFGLSEAAMRSLSLLCMVVTVPVVALIARRLFDGRAAVVAAVLLASHGGMLQYTQETRTYALAALMVSLAALCFVVAVQEGRLAAWLGFGLFAGVAVYAHLFAVLTSVALLASLAALPRRQWRWADLAAALGVLGLIALPSALFIPQAETEQFNWIASQLDGAVDRSLFFLAGNASTLVKQLMIAAVAVLGLSWARRVALRGRGTETWAHVLVVLWAFLPLLLALAVSEVRPMLVPRYLIVSVPGVVLALAGMLRLIWGRRTLVAVTASAVALQLLALPGQLYTNPQVDEGWRDLAETVAAHGQPNDGLIVVPNWQRVTLEYYLVLHPATRRDPAELPVPLSPAEPWGTEDPYGGDHRVVDERVVERFERVWLVLDGQPDRPEHRVQLPDQLGALDGWRLAEESDFGRLSLRRYERGP